MLRQILSTLRNQLPWLPLFALTGAAAGISLTNHFLNPWERSAQYRFTCALILGAFCMLIFSLLFLRYVLAEWTSLSRIRKVIRISCIAVLTALSVIILFPSFIPLPPTMHDLEIIASGDKNPTSTDSQVMLLEVRDPDGNVIPFDLFKKTGQWEEYDGVIISAQEQPASLRTQYWGRTKNDLRMLFKTSPESGMVTINADANQSSFDLYEEDEGDTLVTMAFNRQNPGWRSVLYAAYGIFLAWLLFLIASTWKVSFNWLLNFGKKNYRGLPVIVGLGIIAGFSFTNHFLNLWDQQAHNAVTYLWFTGIAFSLLTGFLFFGFLQRAWSSLTRNLKIILLSSVSLLVLFVVIFYLPFTTPLPPTWHTLEISRVERTEPGSPGDEITLVEIRGPDGNIIPFRALTKSGEWSEEGGFLVHRGDKPASLYYDYFGRTKGELQMLFRSNPRGGIVQVVADTDQKTISLNKSYEKNDLHTFRFTHEDPTWSALCYAADAIVLGLIFFSLLVIWQQPLRHIEQHIIALKRPKITSWGDHLRKILGQNKLKISIRSWKEKKVLIICLMLTAYAVAVMFFYRGSSQPWNRVTVPFTYLFAKNFPLYGYTHMYNGDFYHKEHLYPFQQMDMLKGNPHGMPTMYIARIFYAFLGNFLTMVFNSYYALLLLNLILYLLCAYLIYRFSRTLFQDQTEALFCAALFVLSILGPFHLSDTSAHLLAILFYFFFAQKMLVHLTEKKPLTWSDNIGYSALLGLWSITYPSFFYGLIIYLIVLVIQKKFIYALLPILAAFATPQVLNRYISAAGLGNMQVLEISQLNTTLGPLGVHINYLQSNPYGYMQALVYSLIDHLFIDQPLNILLAVFCLVFFRFSQKWYLAALFLIPILTAMIWFPIGTARGYITSSAILATCVLTAHVVFTLIRKLGDKYAQPIVIALLLMFQFAWANASAFGIISPSYAYTFGPTRHLDTIAPPRFVRMSGDLEDTPRLVYGSGELTEYLNLPSGSGRQPVFATERGQPGNNMATVFRQIQQGIFIQSWMMILLMISLAAMSHNRNKGLWMPIFFLLFLLNGFASSRVGMDYATLINFDRNIILDPNEKLSGSIRLSDAFVASINQCDHACTIDLFMQFSGGNAAWDFSVDGMVASPANPNHIFIPIDQFNDIIEKNQQTLTFSLSPRLDRDATYVMVAAWQKNRPEERRSIIKVNHLGEQETLQWFPAIEIRLLSDYEGPLTAHPSILLLGY